jgi:hypothetical protein
LRFYVGELYYFIKTAKPEIIQLKKSIEVLRKRTGRYGKDGLYAALLWRAATVVGQRGNVLDGYHLNTVLGKGADSTFASRTRTLHEYIHLLQASIDGHLGAISRGRLCCVGRVLLRASEAHLPGRRPRDDLSILIGQGYDDVVERRADVSISVWIYFYDTLFCGHLSGVLATLCFCHCLEKRGSLLINSDRVERKKNERSSMFASAGHSSLLLAVDPAAPL